MRKRADSIGMGTAEAVQRGREIATGPPAAAPADTRYRYEYECECECRGDVAAAAAAAVAVAYAEYFNRSSTQNFT